MSIGAIPPLPRYPEYGCILTREFLKASPMTSHEYSQFLGPCRQPTTGLTFFYIPTRKFDWCFKLAAAQKRTCTVILSCKASMKT